MSILYFLYRLTSLCLSSTVAYGKYLHHFCPNTTTFTAKSSFQPHRDQLLRTLVSNATRDNGFYYASAGGQISNETVNGLFLCRGDLSKDACSDCLFAVASDVVKRCPIEKKAIIWYDYCMIRYSNYSFFSIDEDSPFHFKWNWNEENVRQEGDAFEASFNYVVGNTMKLLVQQVASATKKFATKESYTKILFGQPFYSLGQCTQDLSTADCNSCLTRATENLQSMNATGKQGAILLSPSCNMRFDLEPFYTALPPPPS
ncbi:putative Gnk2-like domain-containing protein [Rosa chinensis]|uniref:Putative Gnk2-like domain-containing protein n=1 Tax=Rosa chinensis TaxID=74649 RepID=A0A2P6RSN0_ROSCH|nr:cysteine-rich receptor-like protein kinase 25 [Rosa chinensis]PRQ49401.1 putative Gnk2-like domain-containing protein [Rosa chinensis]